jgi:translation initiation factor 2B subunit (eIF-2B alpha/beta/delta family)
MNEGNLPEPVTHEMILRMKREGKVIEAVALYRAWRKACEQQRKQDRKDFNKVQMKKRRLALKRDSLCVSCTKEVLDGSSHCVECKKVRRADAQKRKQRIRKALLRKLAARKRAGKKIAQRAAERRAAEGAHEK